MWIVVLLVAGGILGLSSGRMAAGERQLALAVVLFTVAYVAVTKHLL